MWWLIWRKIEMCYSVNYENRWVSLYVKCWLSDVLVPSLITLSVTVMVWNTLAIFDAPCINQEKNPKKRNRNPFPHSLAALALFPWQQKREIKNDLLALKSPNALINIGSIHRYEERAENQSTETVLDFF